ncbi:hypothetical protein [Komagataeibacter europaeus]|nr:hypothetical protein [Komagataeibacter europaeus]
MNIINTQTDAERQRDEAIERLFGLRKQLSDLETEVSEIERAPRPLSIAQRTQRGTLEARAISLRSEITNAETSLVSLQQQAAHDADQREHAIAKQRADAANARHAEIQRQTIIAEDAAKAMDEALATIARNMDTLDTAVRSLIDHGAMQSGYMSQPHRWFMHATGGFPIIAEAVEQPLHALTCKSVATTLTERLSVAQAH